MATMLSCLMKPNARPILFIKNARKRPSKLVRQPRAFLEQRRFYLDRQLCVCGRVKLRGSLEGECPRSLNRLVAERGSR